MSIDTKFYLPPTVRVGDFVDMLAVALGATPYKRHFNADGTGGWSTRVDHRIEIRTNPTIPTMLSIQGYVPDPSGDDDFEIWGTWHFETGNYYNPIRGSRLFMTGCNELRAPVFERLAWLFRGVVDMNDCDDKERDFDYTGYSRAYRPDAEDDEAWYKWQRAKLRFRGPNNPKWNYER